MMYLLLLALYVGLVASALILMLSDLAAGWIFVGFTVISVAGFIFQRARIIAGAFLLASLAVLSAGLLGMSRSEKEWITITVGGCMAALSAFSLYWAAFKFKPGPEPAFAEEDEAGTTKALKCPSCGSPDVEGDYPEFHCPYCGTRFTATDATAD